MGSEYVPGSSDVVCVTFGVERWPDTCVAKILFVSTVMGGEQDTFSTLEHRRRAEAKNGVAQQRGGRKGWQSRGGRAGGGGGARAGR